jgi:hypothetical protein
MEPHPLHGLERDEHKLLAVFKRFGRDGRAITLASLAVHAGTDSRRLLAALRNLATRGLIQEAGGDPFIGSPAAYRLSPALTERPREDHWGDDLQRGELQPDEASDLTDSEDLETIAYRDSGMPPPPDRPRQRRKPSHGI